MIRAIVAFLAGVLTAVQALLIVAGREGICLNEGCEIVDKFPKLPSLYFNIAGCIFFFILSWCFLKGRKGPEYWHQFAEVLLLTGLAGQGVLLFFQYSIVTAFCSYCLIIFSTILLLNFLCGVRQLFTSVTIFIAVFAMLSQSKYGNSEGRKKRKQLLEYCKLDTLAMVRLVEELVGAVEK